MPLKIFLATFVREKREVKTIRPSHEPKLANFLAYIKPFFSLQLGEILMGTS